MIKASELKVGQVIVNDELDKLVTVTRIDAEQMDGYVDYRIYGDRVWLGGWEADEMIREENDR